MPVSRARHRSGAAARAGGQHCRSTLRKIERHIDDHIFVSTDPFAPAGLDPNQAGIHANFGSRLLHVMQKLE
jgi:hypothetical protein